MDIPTTSQPMSLAEVIPIARQLTAVDKLRLIRILVDELDTGNNIDPFEPGKTYYIFTPYDSYGYAKMLADAMSDATTEDDK